jgi:NADH-quinone oxidoreductase subunit L
MYAWKKISPEKVGDTFPSLYKLFFRKYWMDELYEKAFIENGLYKGAFRLAAWIDAKIVDGIANLMGDGTREIGKGLRKAQTGQLQVYAVAMILGVLVILACFHIFGD